MVSHYSREGERVGYYSLSGSDPLSPPKSEGEPIRTLGGGAGRYYSLSDSRSASFLESYWISGERLRFYS